MNLYSSTITNDGYIEQLYLNKGYTKEQIVSILDLLELKAGEMYIVLYTRDLAIQITVSCYGEGQYTIDDNTNSVKLFSTLVDDTLNGWADYTTYEINDFALPMYDEVVVGNYNYKIVQAIGMSEFAEEILELEPYLFNLTHSVKKKKKLEGTLNAQALSSEIDTIAIGVETRDANARAYDLRVGRIAYAKNEKVVGNISDYFGEFEGEAIKSELTIPQISNIVLSEYGMLSWDDVDISSFEEYNPSVVYEILINNFTATSTTSSLDIWNYLSNGENMITVIAKITIQSNDSITVTYSKQISIEVYVSKLPYALAESSAASKENIIYIFGGVDVYGNVSNKILKLNVDTQEISELNTVLPHPLAASSAAAVGDNIYIFGGYSEYVVSPKSLATIYKFNTVDETIKLLDGEKQSLINGSSSFGSCCVVGTDIYYIGGIGGGGGYTDSFYKFNTVSETIELLRSPNNYLQPNKMMVSIKNDIYVFGGGGFVTDTSSKIIKYDTTDLTSSFTELSITLPQPLYAANVISIKDNIYILGGFSEKGRLDTIFAFNTATNSIEELSLKLPNAKGYAIGCQVGNSLFSIGGNATGRYLDEIVKFAA